MFYFPLSTYNIKGTSSQSYYLNPEKSSKQSVKLQMPCDENTIKITVKSSHLLAWSHSYWKQKRSKTKKINFILIQFTMTIPQSPIPKLCLSRRKGRKGHFHLFLSRRHLIKQFCLLICFFPQIIGYGYSLILECFLRMQKTLWSISRTGEKEYMDL